MRAGWISRTGAVPLCLRPQTESYLISPAVHIPGRTHYFSAKIRRFDQCRRRLRRRAQETLTLKLFPPSPPAPSRFQPSMICPETTTRLLLPSETATGLPTKHALRSTRVLSMPTLSSSPTKMKRSIVSPIWSLELTRRTPM